MKKQTGQVEHPHHFNELRKEIARLETFFARRSIAYNA